MTLIRGYLTPLQRSSQRIPQRSNFYHKEYKTVGKIIGMKREWEQLRFTPGWDTTYSREPYFFTLPPQSWHKENLKHLYFFFVLPPQGWYRSILYRGHHQAFPFSSGIILTFNICESCTFWLFSNSQRKAIWLPARPAPRMAWHLVSLSVFYAHSSRVKNFGHYIFFRHPHTA